MKKFQNAKNLGDKKVEFLLVYFDKNILIRKKSVKNICFVQTDGCKMLVNMNGMVRLW